MGRNASELSRWDFSPFVGRGKSWNKCTGLEEQLKTTINTAGHE